MPGGRLTHQDRRGIASGLAEGLGYAEIARRLNRPTSTISREVARNGGSHGYLADHAHHSTERRARRRRPVPPPESPGPPSSASASASNGNDPEAVRAFAEEFAALMVSTGLPRMAARVLARLVTTDSGALTSAELVRQLRVSPASVSKAIGYLEGLELVRRERDPHHRRELYLIDDDVWLRTWLTSARTNAMLADVSRRGAEILDTATPAGARLDQMRQFFVQLSDDMAGGPTAAVFSDTLTVLAALVHAVTPRTVDQLAVALGWPPERVADALDSAERHPDIADPVALRRYDGTGAWALIARADRLTPAQREALGQP
ncbi:GbsR/MarR family transcriptional regulator [Streptomyces sp. 35G-GA-8]|uniref:GbsR/MarR family transcriptional regulator n=1 Tax=Streptomyces sp. 35G-GA-8 TaxID=2939434 RepID=UPI00201EADCF|nr:MarR family transcriptional regulator [Streptomyces sp. 35G-GA-8]MCL7379139.1 helix-turn-helix domain-containing protein [Streptomyces sp. 35G-GA-8]